MRTLAGSSTLGGDVIRGSGKIIEELETGHSRRRGRWGMLESRRSSARVADAVPVGWKLGDFLQCSARSTVHGWM